MRLARVGRAGGAAWALVEEGGYAVVEDPFAADPRRTGEVVPAEEARLLAPASPRTVVGMADNTGEPTRLAGRERPPRAFLKPAGTVTGPGEAVPVPTGAGTIVAEAELAVVIGRPARHLTARDALAHVLGVTVGNDVTARDLQAADPLWTTAKGHDGFTPLGPWVVTDLDTDDLPLSLDVDGHEAGPASTADLARSVVECLVFVTSVMTLVPGDVLLTGAPGDQVPITPGQVVRARVGGVGDLVNPVTAATQPTAPTGGGGAGAGSHPAANDAAAGAHR